MVYIGTRCLIKHNSYDEEALSDKIIEAENNVDLIKKVENEGYHYIGTNCCDGIRQCDGSHPRFGEGKTSNRGHLIGVLMIGDGIGNYNVSSAFTVLGNLSLPIRG